MAITKPMLPPKAGYVEVEVDGVRTYRNVATGVLINDEVVVTAEMEQIAALKDQLASTDYKIIKCSEASLVGEELPYDIHALHEERQALREQINELESRLKGGDN